MVGGVETFHETSLRFAEDGSERSVVGLPYYDSPTGRVYVRCRRRDESRLYNHIISYLCSLKNQSP